MSKCQLKKLAVVRERYRLTAEYLEWVRLTGSSATVSDAERDLARHERHVATLERRHMAAGRTWPTGKRVRIFARDLVPAAVFAATAAAVTFMGRWDAGFVGLLDGLAAAFAYLYFTQDVGRLRL